MHKVKAYFTGAGYTISGPDIYLVVSLTPLIDQNGNPLFTDKEHLYRVLIALLKELIYIKANVIYIYNNTAIVEEMNGLKPSDSWAEIIVSYIQRNIMPKINSIVYFNKEAISRIDNEILQMKERLSFNESKRQGQMAHGIAVSQGFRSTQRRTRATSFKEKWFNGPRTA